MRTAPSDRTLRRWLATGKPHRVDRMVDEPGIAARLEALTSLSAEQHTALSDFLTPQPEFEMRVANGVRVRADSVGTASALVDLLGLGFHVGRAVLGTEATHPPGEVPNSH